MQPIPQPHILDPDRILINAVRGLLGPRSQRPTNA